MPTKKKAELPEEMTTPLEAQKSQTEENITASPAEGAPDDACDTSLSQTETDSADAGASSTGIPGGALDEPTESQTEVKRPRRRKKTEPEPSQSDAEPENAPNAKEDGVDAAPKPKRKRTPTKPSVSVLSIDDRPTVETEADKAKNDLLDLIESQRSGRILTGTIQGVEQSADNPRHAFAVLYHGEFKVIIPAAEAVEPPEDYRGRDPDEVLHYMLTKRLGAEVDYIVKGIDPKSGIAAASRLEAIKCVDTSVVLTEAMAKALQLTDRPYVVAEGIVDSIPENRNSTAHEETINIVYAGKLYFRFGIRYLVEAFSLLQDSSYRLILCGNGDAVEYLQKCAMEDSRIILPGQVSPEKVQEYISSAAVLVNPRPNNEEYTKYSFPSKDIEYLSSGKPTVAFLLDGMPKCYQDFLYVVDPDRDISCAISDALKAAISAPKKEIEKRHTQFLQYAAKNLLASAIAEKIIKMNCTEEAQHAKDPSRSAVCNDRQQRRIENRI